MKLALDQRCVTAGVRQAQAAPRLRRLVRCAKHPRRRPQGVGTDATKLLRATTSTRSLGGSRPGDEREPPRRLRAPPSDRTRTSTVSVGGTASRSTFARVLVEGGGERQGRRRRRPARRCERGGSTAPLTAWAPTARRRGRVEAGVRLPSSGAPRPSSAAATRPRSVGCSDGSLPSAHLRRGRGARRGRGVAGAARTVTISWRAAQAPRVERRRALPRWRRRRRRRRCIRR